MATATERKKKEGFEFRIGASQPEHEVKYNGELFPYCTDLKVTGGSAYAEMKVLLTHDIRIRGEFVVTQIEGATADDALWFNWRDPLDIDLALAGHWFRLVVNGEEVRLVSATLHVGEETDFGTKLTFSGYKNLAFSMETYTITGYLLNSSAVKEVRDENIPGEEIH